MSILIDEKTQVVVQGITGRDGAFHTKQMLAYGTKVVAGVTPGKGGAVVEGVPVYDTVREAVKRNNADTSIIFVPAPFAADAALEAADAGVKLIVIVTEGIPVHDMLRVNAYLRRKGARFIGPNCPGLISPGKSKVGIMPNAIHRPGSIGVVSRSGTLTYEVVHHITLLNMGQSTCIGVGGDPVIGTGFIDALRGFEDDPETRAVALIGEIGGSDEEAAADFIRTMKKPVAAFIAGRGAPPGKRMGHAGAIISGGSGTAESKIKALKAAGVRVADTPVQVAEMLKEALK
jgi:succinyl-CoA synthetase alpha subunit